MFIFNTRNYRALQNQCKRKQKKLAYFMLSATLAMNSALN